MLGLSLTTWAQAPNAKGKKDQRPTCSHKLISKNCDLGKDIKLLPEDHNWFTQGFREAIGTFCESCKEYETLGGSSIAENELNYMGQSARNLIKNEILNGRKENELNQYEANLLKRIRAVQFKVLKPELEKSLFGKDGVDGSGSGKLLCETGPNAIFIDITQTVYICPTFGRLPKGNQIAAVAHEIGHAIDPCRALSHVYEMNLDKLTKAMAENKTTNFKSNLLSSLEAAYKTYGKIMTQSALGKSLGDTPELQKILEELVENGVLKVTQAAIPGAHYPLNPVYACLQEKAGFKDPFDINPSLVPKDKKNPDDIKDLRDPKKMTADFTRRVRCSDGDQMKEAVSDIWYARIVAEYLKRIPPKTDAEKHEPFALWSYMICKETASNKATADGHHAHPADLKRIEDLMLADKKVQQGLNCKSEKPDCSGLIPQIFSRPAAAPVENQDIPTIIDQ